jgi:hypothetical protein
MDYNDFIFPQFIQENAAMELRNRLRLFSSTPFSLNYSLTILEFYTMFRAIDSVIKQAINTIKNKKNWYLILKGFVETDRDTVKGIRQINIESFKGFGVIGPKSWCFDAVVRYGVVG